VVPDAREALMGRDDGDRLVIELPAGGSFGYAGFGDPGGVPCLALHGTSSSRLMPGWMFAPGSLTAAGVRMIGVDRPGYGLSTVPWATGFSDWPRAVGALADHLGLGRFAVLSHSLGAAFALACGPALGDRLAVIVIASGMGPLPPGERFRSSSRADNLYWWLARRQASWLLNPLYRVSATMVLRSARGDPQRFTQGMARRLPEADRLTTKRLLARPGAQAALIEDLREATGRAPPPWPPTCSATPGRGASGSIRSPRPSICGTASKIRGSPSPPPASWPPASPTATHTSAPAAT
jgi:pimeloyl-ACP methyl ester carboxylesterase